MSKVSADCVVVASYPVVTVEAFRRKGPTMLPLPLLTLSLWLRVYSHDTGEACYSETAVGLVRTMDLRTWQQAIRPRAAAAYIEGSR